MLQCPQCQAGLECRQSVLTELADRPVFLDYQWWECLSCGAKYHAVLEESRVKVFADDTEHTGYHADDAEWRESLGWSLQCPDAQDKRCQCVVHQQVTGRNFGGDIAWHA